MIKGVQYFTFQIMGSSALLLISVMRNNCIVKWTLLKLKYRETQNFESEILRNTHNKKGTREGRLKRNKRSLGPAFSGLQVFKLNLALTDIMEKRSRFLWPI